MGRVQDIVMVIAAVVVGFSALAYNLAGWLAPNAVQVPEASRLENRYYAAFPETSVDSVMQGAWQDGLEDCLADHVPFRDQAVFFNAGWQRACVAASAQAHGFDVYPTFFGSHYYAVPRDGLVIDRAEGQPADAGGAELDAWVRTLNEAAQRHPDVRFVYDCVARHDQTEANPTYRYYRDRLNPAWLQENLVDRLDPRFDAFVDSVESYDEIVGEWFTSDPHWTLKRALKSYDKVAQRLGLASYPYDSPVVAVPSWYGEYAKNGLDLDFSLRMEDLPLDFSSIAFYELDEDGGAPKQMGMRDAVLCGEDLVETGISSQYYDYFGGGSAKAVNADGGNGRTALFVGDSLSYCLTRYLAANYATTVFLLPGNSRFDSSFESYIEQYDPDDVIVMMHGSKYQMIAEYSPAFMGLGEEGAR